MGMISGLGLTCWAALDAVEPFEMPDTVPSDYMTYPRSQSSMFCMTNFQGYIFAPRCFTLDVILTLWSWTDYTSKESW